MASKTRTPAQTTTTRQVANPTRSCPPQTMTKLANMVCDIVGLDRDPVSGFVLNGTDDGSVFGISWLIKGLTDGTVTLSFDRPASDPLAAARAQAEAMPEPMRTLVLQAIDGMAQQATTTRRRRTVK